MNALLDFTCGFSWVIAYIVAIVHGFRHRTWCIPVLSICMNLSWEFCAVLNRLMNGAASGLPFFIQLSWLIFDMGIFAGWLFFDGKSRKQLCKNLMLLMIVFATVFWATRIAGKWEFSVFLINAIMSVEFIFRLEKDDSCWTSYTIAVAKLIGTFSATILNGLIFRNMMVLWLGGICLMLDSYYVFRLIKFNEAR